VSVWELGALLGRLPNLDILALPEVSRALEQQLIYLMIRCLTEGALSEVTVSGRRREIIVARFEEFLEANPTSRRI